MSILANVDLIFKIIEIDFCLRTRLRRNLVEDLIVSGALDSFDERRTLLWELRTLDYIEDRFDLVYPTEVIDFPALSPVERMLWEQEKLGLSTGDHIMSYYRSWLQERGILGSQELSNCRSGNQVTVAGLKVVRQSPPTTTKTFITLADEAGFINVVVSQKIGERYRKIGETVPLLLVKGMVDHQGSVIDVIATYVTRLPVEMSEVA